MQQNRLENRLANSQKGQDPPKTLVFAANGDFWTIGEIGGTFSVKASKGLAYIHRLLQHPGDEFHVLDLMSGPGTAITSESSYLETASTDTNLSVGRLGDAGEMLDGKAKQDYKRKLVELREQLEDAQELGNSERAAVIESEIDFLAREISRAIGLGGRNRRAGSAAERARLNVTRAIKTALEKISEHHKELGNLLTLSLRTGSSAGLWNMVTRRSHGSCRWATTNGNCKLLTAQLPEDDNRACCSSKQMAPNSWAELRKEPHFVDAWELAQAGNGSVVMIAGAPGIGKTRIAGELAAEASHNGFFTLAGTCYDRNDCVPFILLPSKSSKSALAQTSHPESFGSMLGDAAGELAPSDASIRLDFCRLAAEH